MSTCLRGTRFALLLIAWLPAASASDWYVDAALGSNANPGTSALAWQTITHAVANTPQSGAQTIHVAPGTYDAALGEVFPWYGGRSSSWSAIRAARRRPSWARREWT